MHTEQVADHKPLPSEGTPQSAAAASRRSRAKKAKAVRVRVPVHDRQAAQRRRMEVELKRLTAPSGLADSYYKTIPSMLPELPMVADPFRRPAAAVKRCQSTPKASPKPTTKPAPTPSLEEESCDRSRSEEEDEPTTAAPIEEHAPPTTTLSVDLSSMNILSTFEAQREKDPSAKVSATLAVLKHHYDLALRTCIARMESAELTPAMAVYFCGTLQQRELLASDMGRGGLEPWACQAIHQWLQKVIFNGLDGDAHIAFVRDVVMKDLVNEILALRHNVTTEEADKLRCNPNLYP